ncbi:carboxymuconolactone decarboxylase family protein [Photobacterium sp. SDRW27]|uniref:carboxymuconolactone decarboxylase family protein n=1 Tax=Photobacterium obscurum TaxID=2829490 RepID=UPI0022437732|nr:carboxymuconolactone decarboxylase family protein [Photobacterium obscurum]MCW8329884.1 carboxymuconolactone decarboxylase family protein [Photobacterium obscurum]
MAAKLSKQYLKVKQRHPELLSAVESLGKAAKQDGPLDEKAAQLIQLAAAAAIRSEGAVHSHTKRALEAGATDEEIRHTLILLTSTLGFPSVMAALSWADEKLEANKPPEAGSEWEV